MLLKEAASAPFRLIGVGVDGLTDGDEADAPDLFATGPAPRHAQVERAMDAVRAKFGSKAIRKGRADR